jgi:hypothetical protein
LIHLLTGDFLYQLPGKYYISWLKSMIQ